MYKRIQQVGNQTIFHPEILAIKTLQNQCTRESCTLQKVFQLNPLTPS
jgi:hypothetical protein